MTPRPLPTIEQVVEQLVELAILLPALPDALPRDSGAGGGERVATTANVHTLPVNADVAQVLIRLHGLDVRSLRRQVDQVFAAGDPGPIRRTANTVARCLGDARHALGLDRPNRALPGPRWCPDHDEPLEALVVPGDRGTLVYDRLDRRGKPIDPWIRWTRLDVVVCPHCGRTWTPTQYLWLGRLIKHADHRRAQAQAAQA